MMEGSSPRMRGTLALSGASIDFQRIIPAYAGNTSPTIQTRPPSGDHPRVCGEHFRRVIVASTLQGSSPRMRGTPSRAFAMDKNTGIIPAYAGNTHRNGRRSSDSRDHPRVCGEHAYALPKASMDVGSSPRMRGTHPKAAFDLASQGIIPAYAGNTSIVVPSL